MRRLIANKFSMKATHLRNDPFVALERGLMLGEYIGGHATRHDCDDVPKLRVFLVDHKHIHK